MPDIKIQIKNLYKIFGSNDKTMISHVEGGMGKPEDLINVVKDGGADAVAMADILHYNRATVNDIRRVAQTTSIEVREFKYA